LPQHVSADEKLVMRQGFAGMLWSKQFYHYDLERWLTERNVAEGPGRQFAQLGMVPHADARRHLDAGQVGVSLVCGLGPRVSHATARHGRSCVCEEPVEADAEQLLLHQNGQLPAYEWNFGDVNPPVTPGRSYGCIARTSAVRPGGDIAFLDTCAFKKLLLNFTCG